MKIVLCNESQCMLPLFVSLMNVLPNLEAGKNKTKPETL